MDTNTKIVLDYETTGLVPYDGARPFIVGMEDEVGNVILTRPGELKWNKVFKQIVASDTIEKICHSAKFEIKMSKHMGIIPKGKFHDTMALAVLVNEYQPLNLDGLSIKYFKDYSKDAIKTWLKENKRAFIKEYDREPNYSDVPKETLMKYLEGDLDKTLKLFWLFYPIIKENKKLNAIYDMETDLAYDIVEMEDRGVNIDVDKCKRLIAELRPEQKKLAQEIYDEVGFKFNLASPKQLGQIFKQLQIDTGEITKGGMPKTSYDLIKDLIYTHPFIMKFVIWRTIQKMVSTYLIPFTQQQYGNTVHPNFWQYGKTKAIVTGRFSSTNPSFHTIPSRAKGDLKELEDIGGLVKEVIVPRPGTAFLFFDFKQIEMRIFIHYINDIHAINEIKKGNEIYRIVATKIFDYKYGKGFMDNLYKTDRAKYDSFRDKGKQTALSIIYGMGVDSFAKRLNIPKKEAFEIKRDFFIQLPTAKPWIIQVQKELYTKGYVEDIFGKRYHVPNDKAYKAVNAICQGTAAIIMKKTILKARALAKYNAFPFLTLHDELGLEVDLKNIDIVASKGRQLFEDTTTFKVPLEVDVEVAYDNWHNKIKYKRPSV